VAASSLTRRKTIEEAVASTEVEGSKLKRELSASDVVIFGVGVIVGALYSRAPARWRTAPDVASAARLTAPYARVAAPCGHPRDESAHFATSLLRLALTPARSPDPSLGCSAWT